MDNNTNTQANSQPPVEPEVMNDMPKSENKTSASSTPMDPTMIAVIIWIIPVIGGIIYMNDKDAYIAYMAKQGLYVSIIMIVLNIILGATGIGLCLTPFLSIGWLILAVMMIMKMQKREMYKLPVIGDMIK